MNGCWGGICDVKVFNPYVSTNCFPALKDYQEILQICEVEQGTFTPLVFSATDGMIDQVIVFLQNSLLP